MGESVRTLNGDPELKKSGVSLKIMMKALQQEGQGVLIEWKEYSGEAKLSVGRGVPPARIQRILQQHQQVFREPTRLPPSRDTDHAIPLREGTEPINVRPFRYPHHSEK